MLICCASLTLAINLFRFKKWDLKTPGFCLYCNTVYMLLFAIEYCKKTPAIWFVSVSFRSQAEIKQGKCIHDCTVME